jgi:hypothetical protein
LVADGIDARKQSVEATKREASLDRVLSNPQI